MSRRILIISPTPSHPHNAGNRARIYNLLMSLQEIGHDVYFVHVEETPGDKFSMHECWGNRFFSIPYVKPKTAYRKSQKSLVDKIAARLKGLLGSDPRYTYSIDDWYDDLINDSIKNLSKQINPEVVIAEYVFFSKALENFDSSVLKIIDTHDAFTNRYKLYLKNNQTPRWFSTTKKEEIKGLRRANIAMAIQEKETRFFSQMLQPSQKNPNPKVVTVGHLVSLHSLAAKDLTHSILYVGSCNPINISGIIFFIREVFPKIKAKFQDAHLVLAGEICNVIEDFDECLKLGQIDKLEEAYALADIVINPVQFGTGLKIKSIEALGYSKPLVTTSIGAEGLENGAGEAFVVANKPDDFAYSIINILSDRQKRENLSKKAYHFAKQWNLLCLESLTNILDPT